MNAVVARLTASSLLGRRRAAVLVALPLVLVAVAVVFRAVGGVDEATAVTLLGGFGLGTVVPLLCVVVGTGAVGPEIEDGSIVYLLAKPLRRGVIVASKYAVAVVAAWLLGAVAVAVSALVLVGGADRLALAYGVASLVAAAAYCALFLALAVVTRNAVVVGLLYALIWETTVAGLLPGARQISVRQWSLAVAERVLGTDRAQALGVVSDVGLTAAVVLLVVVTGAALWYAGRRLGSLRLSGED